MPHRRGRGRPRRNHPTWKARHKKQRR
jgi:hypothetical protein